MRTPLLAVVLPMLLASAAHAEVIEISDDGEARVVGSVTADTIAGSGSLAVLDRPESGDPFENAAKRHGLDVRLLKALAWQELRGRNDAVSPKGARGIMQLMPATAASLGVDPRDPVANINGGAAYLAQQLATFGNVPLALAAYNAGPGAVMRYRGVPPYAETRDYVARIMRRWSPQATGAIADRPAALISGDARAGGPEVPAVFAPAAIKSQPILMIEVPAP